MLDSCKLPETLEEIKLREGTAWNKRLARAQLVVLSLSPTTLRSAPDFRPLQAEGRPVDKGETGFRTTPELEMVLGSSFCKPFPRADRRP